jgi:hypothetical protein
MHITAYSYTHATAQCTYIDTDTNADASSHIGANLDTETYSVVYRSTDLGDDANGDTSTPIPR